METTQNSWKPWERVPYLTLYIYEEANLNFRRFLTRTIENKTTSFLSFEHPRVLLVNRSNFATILLHTKGESSTQDKTMIARHWKSSLSSEPPNKIKIQVFWTQGTTENIVENSQLEGLQRDFCTHLIILDTLDGIFKTDHDTLSSCKLQLLRFRLQNTQLSQLNHRNEKWTEFHQVELKLIHEKILVSVKAENTANLWVSLL